MCDSSIGCRSVAPSHMVYRKCPRDSPRRGEARFGKARAGKVKWEICSVLFT